MKYKPKYCTQKHFHTHKNPHRFVIRGSFRLGVCEGGHLYNQSVKYTDIHTDRAQIKLIGNIGTWRSECSLNQGGAVTILKN